MKNIYHFSITRHAPEFSPLPGRPSSPSPCGAGGRACLLLLLLLCLLLPARGSLAQAVTQSPPPGQTLEEELARLRVRHLRPLEERHYGQDRERERREWQAAYRAYSVEQDAAIEARYASRVKLEKEQQQSPSNEESLSLQSVSTSGFDLVPDSVELRALRDLYNSTGGTGWKYSTNWLVGTTSADFGKWYGVTVSNGDVTVIRLSRNYLSGTLPASLGELKMLYYLHLNGNRITGGIPDAMSGLTSMQNLYLGQNGLTGPVPAWLGDLHTLQDLSLHDNGFSGQIPDALGRLTGLLSLNLDGNSLTGSIPSALGNLTSLRSLYLSFNSLSGPVPDALASLASLQHLDFYRNGLSGPVPDWLGSLANLELVSFRSCGLSGNIPASLGNLQKLYYLSLRSNKLTGEIPSSFGGLAGMRSMYLAYNSLSGPVPASLASLPLLENLTLDNTSLTGTLPNFSAHPNRAALSLKIEVNKLDFGSVEPNMTGPGTHPFAGFTYSPQALLGQPDTLEFVKDQPSEIRLVTGGTRNLYQWQKLVAGVWQDIAGATASVYQVSSASDTDAGTYRCRVTNEWGTALTLHTHSITVKVSVVTDKLSPNLPVAGDPLCEPSTGGMLPGSAPVPASLNYVRTFTPRTKITNEGSVRDPAQPAASVQVGTAYFDGLGRPVQTVVKGESPQGRDIVQPVAYDAFGRQPKEYLPYTVAPATGEEKGGYRPQALQEQYLFYADPAGDPLVARSDFGYTQRQFEASPLNRVLGEAAPGESWAGSLGTAEEHKLGYTFRANTSGEVRFWNYDGATGKFISPGFYEAGTLHVSEVRDEQGALTVEYKDKQGRVVMKRAELGAGQGYADTRYVYDDLGNLRVVIQPEGKTAGTGQVELSEQFLSRWCFRYEYDGRSRMIRKQVPGAGPVELVYDKRDQAVFTRDAAQAGRGEWTFTKYDVLGRPVLTGILTDSRTRTQMQDAVGALTGAALYEEPDNSALGYTLNNSSPTGVSITEQSVLTVTYYDKYFGYASGAAYTFDPAALAAVTGYNDRVKGQVTGSAARNLSSGDWLVSANYYDEKYRLIQSAVGNHLGGKDVVTTLYDFTGRAMAAKTTHQTASGTHTVAQRMEYDHAGRLLRQWQAMDGGSEVLLSGHGYSETGQEVERKLHSTDGGAAFLQSVDMRYNVRGWLTRINDASLSSPDDLFGMEFSYDCGFDRKYYNGNISGVKWMSASNGIARAYGYHYDAASRLLQGDYRALSPSTGQWTEEKTAIGGHYDLWGMRYDANGNIRKLQRSGLTSGDAYDATVARTFGAVDNLSYSYEGNRLATVNDGATAVGPAGDFRDNGVKKTYAEGNLFTWEYGYDANGNMTRDENKQITSVTYNYLNLPERVDISGKGYIKFTYSAAGVKLRKEVYEGTTPVVVTDYSGMFVHSPEATFAHTSEGRVLYEPQTDQKWRYEYHLKDHLGNLRVSFAEATTTTSTATMETMVATTEEAEFEHVRETRHQDRARSRTGSHAALLGVGRGRPLGPATRVALQKGDTLKVEAFGMYEAERKQHVAFNLASWLASAAVVSAGKSAAGEQGTGTPGKVAPFIGAGIALAPAVLQKEKRAPVAYLRYIVYDADSNYVSSGYRALSGRANRGWEQLEMEYAVEEDGFAEVYVANESQEEAWFDDMSVNVTSPMLVQENHYDPWGLNLAGIERQGTPDHLFQYNGKERQTELGLGWMDYGARMYDAQIGRWHVVDPLSEKGKRWSLYTYTFNNPVRFIDPDGMWPNPVVLLYDALFRNFQANTTSSFIKSAASNGVFQSRGGITRIGRIYENAVLNSLGENKNTKTFSASALGPKVIPDLVGSSGVNRIDATGSNTKRIDFPQASFVDAKFKSNVSLTDPNNPNQMKGMIDVLSNMKGGTVDGKWDSSIKASDYGAATLTLITPGNAIVGADLIEYATSKNVKVYQRVTQQDEDDPSRIRVAPNAIPLNFIPTERGISVPKGPGQSVQTNWDKR